MKHKVIHATLTDLPEIYQLFHMAILFQQVNNYIGWKSFDRDFIKADVEKGLLYKIVDAEAIICIFSVCYSDALIWREKEKGDSIYLHRVIVNQAHKGERIFQKVIDWAIATGQQKKLTQIRIDTWSKNDKIIAYYKSFGFSFVENYTTADSAELPLQHRNLDVALMALPIPAIETAKSLDPRPDDHQLKKVNLIERFAGIHQHWSQQIIGNTNGQLIKLAKGIGAINWHTHEDQDELFILYKGHLTIQLQDQNIELFPNEMFIVPRRMAHCPVSHGETEFLIMGLNITSNAAGGRPEQFDNQT